MWRDYGPRRGGVLGEFAVIQPSLVTDNALGGISKKSWHYRHDSGWSTRDTRSAAEPKTARIRSADSSRLLGKFADCQRHPNLDSWPTTIGKQVIGGGTEVNRMRGQGGNLGRATGNIVLSERGPVFGNKINSGMND
jgi:hypothetical protein